MKLYRIYQHVNNDYDTFDAAVVAAPDEETAKNMHPYEGVSLNNSTWSDSWCKLEDVQIEYIGEAKEGTSQKVICASYHAG